MIVKDMNFQGKMTRVYICEKCGTIWLGPEQIYETNGHDECLECGPLGVLSFVSPFDDDDGGIDPFF